MGVLLLSMGKFQLQNIVKINILSHSGLQNEPYLIILKLVRSCELFGLAITRNQKLVYILF